MNASDSSVGKKNPPILRWVAIFVGGLGSALAVGGLFTHNLLVIAVAAAVMLAGYAIEELHLRRGGPGSRVEPKPAPAPLPAALLPAGTSLVGVRIRHRDGISDVTEDLDTPTPRRTVAALDTHGRPELLCVIVDENGNVIEAAVHGSELAAAEAI